MMFDDYLTFAWFRNTKVFGGLYGQQKVTGVQLARNANGGLSKQFPIVPCHELASSVRFP